MQSLEERRMEADMVLTYKIFSDCDKKFHEQWFELAADRRPTRQSSGVSNLLARRSNHEYRREFFSNRVVEKWNRLPDTVKAAPTRCLQKSVPAPHRDKCGAEARTSISETTLRSATLSHDILTRGLPGLPRIIAQVYK
jgi:hypothetical protein